MRKDTALKCDFQVKSLFKQPKRPAVANKLHQTKQSRTIPTNLATKLDIKSFCTEPSEIANEDWGNTKATLNPYPSSRECLNKVQNMR